MILKSASSLALIFLLFVEHSVYAQQPGEMLTRDQYLDRLEQRFLSASDQLNEISGAKFKVPNESIVGSSSAQEAFDLLPGPISTKPPKLLTDEEVIRQIMGVEESVENIEIIEETDANESLEAETLEVEVVPPRYLESEFGKFFIQPFLGLSLISEKMRVASDAEVETDLGYGVGLIFGRRWGNLVGEIHFGHYVNEFSPQISGSFETEGYLETSNVGARIGYGIPFSERGTIRGGLGFGFAQRRNYLDISPVSGGSTLSYSESESVFTYDFHLGISYEISIGWDVVLAYRYMNMDEFDIFDDISYHLFELGLGKNF